VEQLIFNPQKMKQPQGDSIRVRRHIAVPEAQNVEALGRKDGVADGIVVSLFRVLAAIKPDDQLCLQTHEIGDVQWRGDCHTVPRRVCRSAKYPRKPRVYRLTPRNHAPIYAASRRPPGSVLRAALLLRHNRSSRLRAAL
jgi:hypothetical protein